MYCIFGCEEIMDVRTVSFRWILPFWYFCFLLGNKTRLALFPKRKQKCQNGSIHRNLTVPTSEREGQLSNPRARAARTPCMEKIYGNLRKPARVRRAGAMYWFCRSQKYSTSNSTTMYTYSCTVGSSTSTRGTESAGSTVRHRSRSGVPSTPTRQSLVELLLQLYCTKFSTNII